MSANVNALLLDGEFVAYYPRLGRLLGSVERAVVLQHLWFRRDRDTGLTTVSAKALADEVGMAQRTAERVLAWLADDERGYLVRCGRASSYDPTSVWEVVTAKLAVTVTATSAVTVTATPAVTSCQNTKNSPENHDTPSAAAEGRRLTTLRDASWRPDGDHRAAAEAAGLDIDEVESEFRYRFECDCPKAPRSRGWGAKFSTFIAAWADDRRDDLFTDHSYVHDQEVSA